jgi:hypothetical protein
MADSDKPFHLHHFGIRLNAKHKTAWITTIPAQRNGEK